MQEALKLPSGSESEPCETECGTIKMPRTYVDNPQNRSLGRVGLPVGSAVHSRTSGNVTFSSSPKTYVDNSMNRSLGRVGLPIGTAVLSRANTSPALSSPSPSTKCYVDNSMNRRLGREGLPLGSAVQSKTPSSPSPASSPASPQSPSTKCYVDNSMNRRLGRVGLPLGSAVQSKTPSSPSPASSPASPQRTYVNNAMNRRLGRVGLPVGTAVHSCSPMSSPGKQASHSSVTGKVYKDNDFNRRHNRVGLPLGSKPIKMGNPVYANNTINRNLGRAGQRRDSETVNKRHLAQLSNWITEEEQNDVENSGFEEASILSYYEPKNAETDKQLNDNCNHVMESLNRARQEDLRKELNKQPLRFSAHSSSGGGELTALQGKSIKLKDLNLLDKIGHGGFGEIWMAEYKDELLAVKFLTQTKVSKKSVEMFEREIINHSRLDHPNIVKFYGPCLEWPDLAIAMEYMDASLWESIHINEVNFQLVHKLQILHDITSGLDYLHSVPLVHGDLKTQNVLLINVPDSPEYISDHPTKAKLSDFGLSLLKSDSDTSQLSAHKSSPAGATLRCSAPEILRGEMLGTSMMLKTDIYSMGLLIMELAVEEIPFETLALPQLMHQVGVLGTKPTVPSGLMLDSALNDLLQQCWSYLPNERPTASQLKKMVSRVDKILQDEE